MVDTGKWMVGWMFLGYPGTPVFGNFHICLEPAQEVAQFERFLDKDSNAKWCQHVPTRVLRGTRSKNHCNVPGIVACFLETILAMTWACR